MRTSDHIAGWHWLVYHGKYRQWVHYEPKHAEGCPRVIWDKVWYEGYIKRGD